MAKKCHFREPLERWHGKPAETLLKSQRRHLYHVYWSLLREFRLKKSLWVICKILGLFVNQLTTDNKYSLVNRHILWQDFQMQLPRKGKTFFRLFFAFCKLIFNFENFPKEGEPHSWCIFKLTVCERRGYINV